MPRRDGTGPFGDGPMTGRGLGANTQGRRYGMGRSYRQDSGRCFGRGLGRCYNIDEVAPRTEKEILQKQKEMLQEEIELINKKLENL